LAVGNGSGPEATSTGGVGAFKGVQGLVVFFFLKKPLISNKKKNKSAKNPGMLTIVGFAVWEKASR
jgi:hypothetical protein